MKILNLTLENFRGIKNLTVKFGDYTDIYGANGVGKTTVANAICWLLIDRPATEEKEFNPKTIGLSEAHHIAEMKVKTDEGEEIAFKKDFYEKYTKKKGAAVAEYTGNVTDYYIDGVKFKQKDYNATMERALGLPLDKAKMLIVLSYFADTMKTEEKRKILFELAEDFTDEDVFNADKTLSELKDYLKIPGADEKLYTIEQWKSIASEERKKLNKDLELIPTRIDEVNKTLPEEKADAAALKDELKKYETEKESLLEEKRDLGKDDASKAAVADLKVEIASAKAEYVNKTADARKEKQDKISALSDELQNISAKIREIDGQIPNIEGQILLFSHKHKSLLGEYAKLNVKTFDKNAEICPTCGQKLPEERIEELRVEFNRKKSERLAEIKSEGQACGKDAINALEEKLKTLKADFQKFNEQHIEVYNKRKEVEGELKAIPAFEDTEGYKELQARMQTLLNAPKESKAEEIDNKLSEIQEKIENVNSSIAKVAAAKESEKRIEELQKELKDTSARLEYLERGIYLSEAFTRLKAKMVTESVNKHFSITRFILFRDQINGGLKEVCEPTGQNKAGEWVEYRSLNFAAKVNTQLDIVNTLNKHYGVNLPVIIDQAESVTEPMKINEQTIRLIVSPKDHMLRSEVF